MSKWLSFFVLFFCLSSFGQSFPIPFDTIIEGKLFWGYKQNNKTVIEPAYSEASRFSESLALVKKEGYYQYLNLKGNKLNGQQFADARPFSEGLAEVEFSNGWGYVNARLEKVIEGQYERTFPFSEGFAAVKKTKWQFVNKKNYSSFGMAFDTVLAGFQNGVALVGMKSEEYTFGAISKLGTWVLPCKQKGIKRLGNDLLLAKSQQDDFQLYTTTGNLLISEIESVRKVNDTLYLFEKEGYFNLFNHKGTVLKKEAFKAYANGAATPYPKWKLTDTSFNALASIEADSFLQLGDHVVRCLNDKKQVVLPKVLGGLYQDIKWFGSRVFGVKKENRWALMDEQGQLLTAFDFEKVQDITPFIKVMSNGKYGIVNKKGETILDKDFMTFVYHPNTHRFIVHHKDYLGTYDLDSARLLKTTEYDSLSELNKYILLGWKGEHALLLNENLGRVDSLFFHDVRLVADTLLLGFEKDSVYRRSIYSDSVFVRYMPTRYFLNDTLALVKVSDTLMGVYHFLSDSLYTFEADSAWRHPNMPDRLLTKKKDTLGFAHIEGRILANYPRNFSYIGREENGFLQVVAKRYVGFIDTNGHLLISTRYDSAQLVKEGLASVKLRGKWGFVDYKDKLVVQPYYQKVGVFTNGKAPVWLAGLATLVDLNGQELFKPKFQGIYPSKNGNWITTKNNVYGFLHSDAQEAFNPKFEKVLETETGFYIVRLYGKEGVLNSKLQIVRPFSEKEIRNIGGHFFAIRE